MTPRIRSIVLTDGIGEVVSILGLLPSLLVDGEPPPCIWTTDGRRWDRSGPSRYRLTLTPDDMLKPRKGADQWFEQMLEDIAAGR
jgi:hypothetical protein